MVWLCVCMYQEVFCLRWIDRWVRGWSFRGDQDETVLKGDLDFRFFDFQIARVGVFFTLVEILGYSDKLMIIIPSSIPPLPPWFPFAFSPHLILPQLRSAQLSIWDR